MTHADADPHAGGAARRKLSIGIRTFRETREEGCCYVDNIAWGAAAGRPGGRTG